MRVGYLIIVSSIAFLSACSTATKQASIVESDSRQSLEELRRKCLTEAEWDSDRYAQNFPVHIRHQIRDSAETIETTHLKSLCRDLSSPPGVDSEQGTNASSTRNQSWKMSMGQACDEEIKHHKKERIDGNENHLERYNSICQKMIESAPSPR